MPWKFNLKGIGIPDDALRSHSQNKRTTGKIRGLKEVGNDGEDGNGVVVVFEAVQGINVETALFCWSVLSTSWIAMPSEKAELLLCNNFSLGLNIKKHFSNI